MRLTQDQEAELLRRYDGILRSVAARYYRKYYNSYSGRFDFDDLLQEITIVFLKHIRDVDSEEKIWPIPTRDFMHAVCMQVLGSLPVSVPRRTTSFSSIVREHSDCASLDEICENGYELPGKTDHRYDDVVESMAFGQFYGEITPEDRRLLRVMARSGSATRAGEVLGIHRSSVARKLAPLKKKYLNDCR